MTITNLRNSIELSKEIIDEINNCIIHNPKSEKEIKLFKMQISKILFDLMDFANIYLDPNTHNNPKKLKEAKIVLLESFFALFNQNDIINQIQKDFFNIISE